jgi:hypothetical protein
MGRKKIRVSHDFGVRKIILMGGSKFFLGREATLQRSRRHLETGK